MKISIVLVLSGILALWVNASQAMPIANAKVVEANGTVTIHESDSDESTATALQAGNIVKQNAVISTGSQGTAKLAFTNGSIIALDPNTQVEITALIQKPYSGTKTYQQLDRDPSQSITLLSINYGSIMGHVKKLSPTSKFNVKTPFGVTIIRGTRFRVSFEFDKFSNNFRASTNNIDGIVEVITEAEGDSVDYGMQNNADVRLATSGDSSPVAIPIPPAHTMAITLPASDPRAEEIIDLEKNIAPDNSGLVIGPVPQPRESLNPDRNEVRTDPDDSAVPSVATP